MLNKKGQINFDRGIVYSIFVIIAMIVITIFVATIVINSVNINPKDTISTDSSGTPLSFVNQTIGNLNQTQVLAYSGLAGLDEVTLSNVVVTNRTNDTQPALVSANYTIYYGYISSTGTVSRPWNGTPVNISATYVYKQTSQSSNVVRNVTIGFENFVENTDTWLLLVTIVILVTLLGIIIVTINKFVQKVETGGL